VYPAEEVNGMEPEIPSGSSSHESPLSTIEYHSKQLSAALAQHGAVELPNTFGHFFAPAEDRKFSMDTEDIVAVGAVILCIGGVFASITVALGLAFGKVQGPDAVKIILSCVGGSSIAAIIGKISAIKTKKKK
jgi:uncharacterized integral membrane protein